MSMIGPVQSRCHEGSPVGRRSQVVTATKKFAFQQLPKHSNKGAFCVDGDKLFHTRGPATQNARSPTVVRHALGMSSLAEAEDHSLL